MQEQNYKNHPQMVPGFHYVTFTLVFALLAGSVKNLIQSTSENKFLAELVIIVALIFVLIAWYARTFALKAQDRAIRAEEGLRYYILTGKAFPNELKISQIIEKLGIPNATLSFHLKELVQSDLLMVERQSRNLIYRPNAKLVQDLSEFLLDNCCGGQECAPSKTQKKAKQA